MAECWPTYTQLFHQFVFRAQELPFWTAENFFAQYSCSASRRRRYFNLLQLMLPISALSIVNLTSAINLEKSPKLTVQSAWIGIERPAVLVNQTLNSLSKHIGAPKPHPCVKIPLNVCGFIQIRLGIPVAFDRSNGRHCTLAVEKRFVSPYSLGRGEIR